jgi:hypothetical protein
MMAGGLPQQSSEGILQMMKKREKLNNSALSTTKQQLIPGQGLLP